ncbi:hypothetical protein F511_41625 [Dorcoceras hygrometricum]|uniref:Uncharacterized protein n=1 Tax=Dorcoceras hygrometricum TaxID=472368 RepID=A0A2Z7CGB6_9LAMI|nr:hypothetical protein F511_41625 [Dorcoceras hygrometricum]
MRCTVAVYEENLQEFFANARLERNTMISTIRGSSVKSLSPPSKQAAMALVFIQNALQVNFESVLSFPSRFLHEEAQKQSDGVNSSQASLSSQLAEVVAHLMRAGDVKKGKGGSRSSRKRESSSGDRFRDSDGNRKWFEKYCF